MNSERPILVTGGAGFIGSNFVDRWLSVRGNAVVNFDLLTYAGRLENLAALADEPRHVFIQGDINDGALLARTLALHHPRAVVHFAAESHVDKSISAPENFVRTNVNGTFQLLEAARTYWTRLNASDKAGFRFVHVSTDEVYGSLGPMDAGFSEATAYAPNSPYAASKAAADHFVRAYHHTFGLPTIITNCSNNYGPRQFPEKLIPLMILNAIQGLPLPVYGDGQNVRDWLYVEDHCEAIIQVLERGKVGNAYNIGGGSEKTNLEVVQTICAILDELRPGSQYAPHAGLVQMVEDRPGHDRRYAIDSSKLQRELGWKAKRRFATGIRETIVWYLQNVQWIEQVSRHDGHQSWAKTRYARV